MAVDLKQTALFDQHIAAGARMVDFGGWHMPVQYTGVMDEHKTVRTAVGLFDVSHMGEIVVSGRGALDFMQSMVTNDVSKMAVGQAQYNALCDNSGRMIDDLVIYRRGVDNFFICANASNVAKDFAWLEQHLPKSGVHLQNVSQDYAQIAVQGPQARALMSKVVDVQLDQLKYYHFAEGKIFGVPAILARTGYTGELGYEVYLPQASASRVWSGCMDAGSALGIKPCGLGARDTLRLEMGYLLYGNDMDQTSTALECGLSWVTKFDKGVFVGSSALQLQKTAGLKKQLVGFEMIDRAIGRHDYPVFDSPDGQTQIGIVTSGTAGPSVQKNIGMAYVAPEFSKLGSEIWIQIRNERKKAKIVKKSFYTNGTAQI